jgi:DNA-directed RNA polymerase subunit RPC12/RpoP
MKDEGETEYRGENIYVCSKCGYSVLLTMEEDYDNH